MPPRCARQKPRGSIIIVALTSVMFLIVVGTSLMNLTLTEIGTAARSARLASAFHLADAGLDVAIQELWKDRAWSGSAYMPGPASTGGYEVTVDTISPRLRRVVSTGHVPINDPTADGYQRRQIEAILELSDPSPFEEALFTQATIWLDSNAIVDSYDSRVGSYGPGNIHADGDIGTNASGPSTITLTSNVEVHGDAVVGPGGDPGTDIVMDPSTQITGTGWALTQPKDLTPAAFPSGTATTSIVLGGSDTMTLPSGTYRYTHVELDSNAQVFVTGDVTLYVEQDFRLLSNSRFVTSCAACTVTIYVEGTVDPSKPSAPPAVELDSNALLSAGGVPTRLQLFVSGDGTAARPVVIRSNAGFYGAIHAPVSTFLLDSNAIVYGAVIAAEADLLSNSRIHYDEALKDVTSSTLYVRLKSWREL